MEDALYIGINIDKKQQSKISVGMKLNSLRRIVETKEDKGIQEKTR